VAHVFFIMAFARKAASPSSGQVMLIAFEVLAVGGNLAPMFVKGAPDELKVPVGVYITIILLMVISATLAEAPAGVGPSALAGCNDFDITLLRRCTRRSLPPTLPLSGGPIVHRVLKVFF